MSQRKRGRPRKKKANSDDESQSTIQLTIAAYGKKKSSTTEEAPPKPAPTKQKSRRRKEAPRTKPAPIVISLPISDEMEERHTHQATLDQQLMEYDANEFLHQPDAIMSRSSIASAAFLDSAGGEEKLTVKRCDECRMEAGPCDSCLKEFNPSSTRSLADFESERSADDKNFSRHAGLTIFKNPVISDEPIKNAIDVQYRPEVEDEDPFDRSGSMTKDAGNEDVKAWNDVAAPRSNSDEGETSGEWDAERYEAEIARLRLRVRELERCNTSLPKQASHSSARQCMWHLEYFDGQPVGLPVRWNNTTGCFDSVGYFCSLECAYAYRLEHRSVSHTDISLLHKAHRMLSAGQASAPRALVPAPPRQALPKFGGNLPLDAFLAYSTTWKELQYNPFIPVTEFISELRVGTIGMQAKQNSSSFASAVPDADGLVRRHNKPHPNAANQWENALRRAKLRR